MITAIVGSVVSSVIDENRDEPGRFMPCSEMGLLFRTPECEKTHGRYKKKFRKGVIRMPTDKEIVTHTYAAMFETRVRDVKKGELGVVTCQACTVCPEINRFGLSVISSGMQPLLDAEWTRTD